MKWLGLDIGGANIKAASTDGKVLSMPFRFWIEHKRLGNVLNDLIGQFQNHHVAVTMTAELADCFDSRRSGVEYIVDCVAEVCKQLSIPEPTFAGTDLKFRTAETAKRQWLKTAASNWALMACFAGRFLPDQTGVAIDMGSTTTDIIPVHNGTVAATGQTDLERLVHGELVYLGADRTAVCSIVDHFEWRNSKIPVANELFATIGDAMLVCGLASEAPENNDTADGRPRTVECAVQRICRMVCEDLETIGNDAAKSFANQILEKAGKLLLDAVQRLQAKESFENVIITGSGVPFLQTLLADYSTTTLGSHIDISIDAVAPAWAVAALASESRQS